MRASVLAGRCDWRLTRWVANREFNTAGLQNGEYVNEIWLWSRRKDKAVGNRYLRDFTLNDFIISLHKSEPTPQVRATVYVRRHLPHVLCSRPWRSGILFIKLQQFLEMSHVIVTATGTIVPTTWGSCWQGSISVVGLALWFAFIGEVSTCVPGRKGLEPTSVWAVIPQWALQVSYRSNPSSTLRRKHDFVQMKP
jgi:hypothetical protein